MAAETSKPSISFVVPIYNEASHLRGMFDALLSRAGSLGRSFELVCVDDGSQDGSAAILRGFAEREGRIRWESLPANRGKGAAVRRGMELASGELRIFMDADLATDLEATERILTALEEGADVAIGNRNAPLARITRRQPWGREFLGKCFGWISRVLFAPEVHDFTCGFKGFRAEAADSIFRRTRIDRWAFDVELIAIARARNLRIEQVEVVWEHREGSKVSVPSAVLGSLLDLVRILALRLAGRYGKP